MAKNYTFAEAVKIINAGTDMEAIADIGRRYPILLHKVTNVTAKAGEAFVDLMSYMPEHLTANKVNTAMKNVGNDDETAEDVAEDEAETDEKPAKATKATKAAKETKAETSGSDYESMSGKELWDILGKAGKRKDCKEKMGGTKKELMIEYINKYGLGDTVEEETEAEVETEAEDSSNPYEGISAMELFKECKKRGLKAAPKKPAKYYIEMLMEADAKAAEATEESESEDDDWGDEADEVKEEPKAEKKATKKAAKKPAKDEAADDDDDWDI